MFYYLVDNNSKMYKDLERCQTSHRRWFDDEVRAELTKLLGYDYGSEFACTELALYLTKIPEGTESQFCKEPMFIKGKYYYKAKKNSKLHRGYKKICDKFNLVAYSFQDFGLTYFWGIYVACDTFKDGDTLVFVISTKKEYNKEDLKPMTEREYLELKLKYMD